MEAKLKIIEGKETILNKEEYYKVTDYLHRLGLCLDSLIRILNGIYLKVVVQTKFAHHLTNNLLFVDHLKLLVENDITLEAMLKETKCPFKSVDLQI
jgi:hypothetical protein